MSSKSECKCKTLDEDGDVLHSWECPVGGYTDRQGRTPAERRKLIWCEKHKRPGLQCTKKRCRTLHPGLGPDDNPNRIKVRKK